MKSLKPDVIENLYAKFKYKITVTTCDSKNPETSRQTCGSWNIIIKKKEKNSITLTIWSKCHWLQWYQMVNIPFESFYHYFIFYFFIFCFVLFWFVLFIVCWVWHTAMNHWRTFFFLKSVQTFKQNAQGLWHCMKRGVSVQQWIP